jgi:hypothetical protein
MLTVSELVLLWRRFLLSAISSWSSDVRTVGISSIFVGLTESCGFSSPVCYGKQLLENVVWRQECAAKVGLGFTLSFSREQPQVVGQVGQVLHVAEHHAIAL